MKYRSVIAIGIFSALFQMQVDTPALAFKMASDDQLNHMTEQQHEEYISQLLDLLVKQCRGEVVPEHLLCFIRSENRFYDLGPDGKLKPYTGNGIFR